jgi:hypothetical protein
MECVFWRMPEASFLKLFCISRVLFLNSPWLFCISWVLFCISTGLFCIWRCVFEYSRYPHNLIAFQWVWLLADARSFLLEAILHFAGAILEFAMVILHFVGVILHFDWAILHLRCVFEYSRYPHNLIGFNGVWLLADARSFLL